MAIGEGIAAAKGALEVSRLALDLLRSPKIDGEQVRNKLIEMQDLIISAKRALSDAEDENRDLNRKVDESNRLLALVDDLEFSQDGGFYLRKSEKAQGLYNPHCPVCWGEKRQAVPLAPMNMKGYFRCTLHSVVYHNAEGEQNQRRLEAGSAIPPRRGGGPNSWMG